MKKLIFNITLMLLAIMSLNSCGDQKDGQLTVYYNVALSSDMAKMADLAITYKGENGITVTDTISGKEVWEKKIRLDSFPAEFGLVDYTFIPKPESKLKKDSYELFAEFSAFTREAKFSLNYDLVNPFNLKREKSALFFDLANDHDAVSILVTATKDQNGFKFSGKSRPDVYIRINNPEDNSETE